MEFQSQLLGQHDREAFFNTLNTEYLNYLVSWPTPSAGKDNVIHLNDASCQTDGDY